MYGETGKKQIPASIALTCMESPPSFSQPIRRLLCNLCKQWKHSSLVSFQRLFCFVKNWTTSRLCWNSPEGFSALFSAVPHAEDCVIPSIAHLVHNQTDAHICIFIQKDIVVMRITAYTSCRRVSLVLFYSTGDIIWSFQMCCLSPVPLLLLRSLSCVPAQRSLWWCWWWFHCCFQGHTFTVNAVLVSLLYVFVLCVLMAYIIESMPWN